MSNIFISFSGLMTGITILLMIFVLSGYVVPAIAHSITSGHSSAPLNAPIPPNNPRRQYG